jgi:hypothetical protein
MRLAVAAAVAAIALTTAACSDGEVPDSVPSAPAATSTAAAKPARLHPGGTAAQNRAFFDQTNKSLVAKTPMPGGKAVVDNLVGAGFDVKHMEVSPDKTSIGLDAEAIYFSVRFGKQCLIGQISSVFGYRSLRADALDSGTCLIGTTRTIDWVAGG